MLRRTSIAFFATFISLLFANCGAKEFPEKRMHPHNVNGGLFGAKFQSQWSMNPLWAEAPQFRSGIHSVSPDGELHELGSEFRHTGLDLQNRRKLEEEDSSAAYIGMLTEASPTEGVWAGFVPHNETRTCTAQNDRPDPFNKQVRGVNLGGWLVLEPWITPSLFYQFLGKDEGEVAVDMYTFCEVLGQEEGNRQLRRHWDSWVTKDIIAKLKELQVNSLRLPVGDFMYEPYEPFIGCTDGAAEYVDKVLDWAEEYDMKVLLDIHTIKGSQNGFDNSGQQKGMEWTTKLNTYPAGLVTFQHWPVRSAEWFGLFDKRNFTYPEINYDNIQHSLRAVTNLVHRHKAHPAVLGVEPVNEPWEFTPMNELKQFYWEGYLITKRYAPTWKFVMHDSFRFDPKIWGGFMADCPDRALDTHIYQAWNVPSGRLSFYNDACSTKTRIAAMEAAFGPVIVGEWSLATDNCAMYLNGFNDNLPGFPMLPCKYVKCSDSYLPEDQPGVPLDPSKPLQGPYGSGISGPSWGLCPTNRDWMKEHSDDPLSGTDWILAPPTAPPGRDGTDEVMTNLARKKIQAFSMVGHGYYFWNFRTELEEPQWNYMAASERKWITDGSFHNNAHIRLACQREDEGAYECISKRNVLEENLKGSMRWTLEQEGEDSSYIEDMHGDELFDEADSVFNGYWKRHFMLGVTCDFGGTAMLTLGNETMDDDEFSDDWTDDMYWEKHRTTVWEKIAWIIGGALVGSILGFVTAMKTSRRFNMRVRESIVVPRSLKNSAIFHGRGSILGNENMPLIPETYERRGVTRGREANGTKKKPNRGNS